MGESAVRFLRCTGGADSAYRRFVTESAVPAAERRSARGCLVCLARPRFYWGKVCDFDYRVCRRFGITPRRLLVIVLAAIDEDRRALHDRWRKEVGDRRRVAESTAHQGGAEVLRELWTSSRSIHGRKMRRAAAEGREQPPQPPLLLGLERGRESLDCLNYWAHVLLARAGCAGDMWTPFHTGDGGGAASSISPVLYAASFRRSPAELLSLVRAIFGADADASPSQAVRACTSVLASARLLTDLGARTLTRALFPRAPTEDYFDPIDMQEEEEEEEETPRDGAVVRERAITLKGFFREKGLGERLQKKVIFNQRFFLTFLSSPKTERRC